MIRRISSIAISLASLGLCGRPLAAQENYEIQVYPSATVGAGVTMFELHSNYTLNGSLVRSSDGLAPTNHAVHETVEITHGFSSWTELGFYWFMAKPDGQNFQWVGTHIRPRFMVPESWHWPVGVSISQEIGWAKSQFSPDEWTYELRPIIDKQMGPWYASINPVLGKALSGPDASQAFDFTPNIDLGYDVTKKFNLSIEYYGATGTINRVAPVGEQEHLFFGAINYDFGPEWEFNVGYGAAMTAGGDKHILKMILGRRFGPKSSE